MGRNSNPLKTNTFKEETLPGEASALPQEEGLKKPGKERKPPKEKAPPKEKKPRKEKSEADIEKSTRRFRVGGLFMMLLGMFLLFSLVSYLQTWKNDFNFSDTVFRHFSFGYYSDSAIQVDNWMGKLGALAGYLFISKWFGVSSLLFVVILFNTGIRQFFLYKILPVWRTIEYSFFAILWVPVFLYLVFPGEDILYGVYGFQTSLWLTEYLGTSGLVLVLIFTGLSILILGFNIPFRWLKSKPKIEIPVESPADTGIPAEAPFPVEPEPGLPVNFMSPSEEPIPAEEPGELTPEPTPADNFDHVEHSNIELLIEKPVEEVAETPAAGGIREHQTIDMPYDPTLELSSYKFPPLTLLADYGGESINVRKEELEANKDKIVETLKNYDIKIQRIKATIGPAVTLYEIVPEAGVRISRIKNLEDDIALSLAAMGIRIIAPIPGKGTIGIEVPNQNPEIVSIKSMLGSEKFKTSTFELPFVLGKTISNETFIADLAKMPHLLMAGATGQGKSVGLNTIITSLLYKKHPATVKFVMIDPKKVELTLYSKIERHYLAKLPDSEEAIITDTKKVIRTLNSLNIEMDSRYDLLRDAQVRNIKEYNEKFLARKLNPNDNHKFLPYIILVIDEFADLIMTAGREIETPLTRLAQLARATGIHLIIATQRPSVNIITGTIKANFPARIAFRVISKIDSRTILDSSGADQLIGRGDMLLSTGSDLIRLQCAFVDTPEIDRVTEFIGSQRGYPEAFPLPEYYDEENGSGKDFDPNERDEFFAEAARLVVQHQHGSTSLIQRKLKLGYNRAGRIIDQLEAAGIVGTFEGSKARDVKFKDLGALEEYLKGIEI